MFFIKRKAPDILGAFLFKGNTENFKTGTGTRI